MRDFESSFSSGKSNGTLALAASYAGNQSGRDKLAVGDLNNDGRDDLVIMNGWYYGPNIFVLLQKPDGLFDTPTPYDLDGDDPLAGVALGDLNGDGRSDLAVSYGGNRPRSRVAIWRQTTIRRRTCARSAAVRALASPTCAS